MKKIIGLVGIFALGVAFANPVLAKVMTTEETRAVMQEFLTYYMSGKEEDLEKWPTYFADDIEVHYQTTGPFGQYFFGKEGFLNWYLGIVAKETDFWAGVNVDKQRLWVDGSTAILRLRVRARRNGAPYVNEYVRIHTWEDRKIVHMEVFYNGAATDAYLELLKK